MTKSYNYGKAIDDLIISMKNCISDDFENFYQTDTLDWIEQIIEIKKRMDK